MRSNRGKEMRTPRSGLAAWLLDRWRKRVFRGGFGVKARPRMELVERITLGPRQNLALIEADGRRFLIATSGETAPVFYSLDGQKSSPSIGRARVSW